MVQIKAKILYNRRIRAGYFRLAITAGKIIKEAQPGQFLNIKVNNSNDPLLRRPFSIHRAWGNKIEVLYEVVGPATGILSQLKPGGYLDVIGPLGNGFRYPLSAIRYPLSILVAGGMGVAPLVFLAERLACSVGRIAYRKLSAVRCPLSANKKRYPLNAIALIGAKSKDQILCEKEFKGLGCDVRIATDDGSKGSRGTVTDLLKDILRTALQQAQRTALFACGPRPMLKEISLISKKYNIPAQISLEGHMACGIGACLGCVVTTKGGLRRVCKEGPVFKADEIAW